MILLDPGGFAGPHKFDGCWKHARESRGLLCVEASRRFVTGYENPLLKQDWSGIDTIIQPEQRRTGRFLAKQNSPWDHRSPPHSRQRRRMKANVADARDRSEGCAADLRPADNKHEVDLVRAQRVQNRL